MPVTINGDGSITGLAVGGLPDGSVDADTLASNAVTNAKIAMEFSGGAITIGGLRIVTGSQTLDGAAALSGGWYYLSLIHI